MITAERIAISAPDAASAFLLEKRLSHLHPTSIGRREGWIVELEDDGDRLDEVIAAVEHWLREVELAETVIDVGGATRTVECRVRPVRALGAEYEQGEVLTHEP
jgi:hypothetical protein